MKVGFRSLASVAVALALMWIAVSVISAQQQGAAAIAIDNDDIGGLVTSTKGPEAGVWVIAETRELPTRVEASHSRQASRANGNSPARL